MKIRQSKDTCMASFPDSLIIFSLKSYRCFILNDTASSLWHFCRKSKDLNQISNFLHAKYQVDISRIRKDVKRLIYQLEKRELVVRR